MWSADSECVHLVKERKRKLLHVLEPKWHSGVVVGLASLFFTVGNCSSVANWYPEIGKEHLQNSRSGPEGDFTKYQSKTNEQSFKEGCEFISHRKLIAHSE